MNNVADFYKYHSQAQALEGIKRDAEKDLNDIYPKLIALCPHSDVAETSETSQGRFRICKICGVEDHASRGGTPGDEYNYSTNGHPDDDFWGRDCKPEKVDWNGYSDIRYKHSHHYYVRNGKANI